MNTTTNSLNITSIPEKTVEINIKKSVISYLQDSSYQRSDKDLCDYLDGILKRIEGANSISIKDGSIPDKKYHRIFKNNGGFPSRCYLKCHDLDKTNSIVEAYRLVKKQISQTTQNIKYKIIKKKISCFSNYLGSGSIDKESIGRKIFSKEFKDKPDYLAFCEKFFEKLGELFPKKEITFEDSPKIIIGTSSSGGAHRSIANAIFERLVNRFEDCKIVTRKIEQGEKSIDEKEIQLDGKAICRIINETELTDNDEDPLNMCVGISYSRCYSRIAQQKNNPILSAKLRKLSDHLRSFIKDPHPQKIKEKIKGAKYFISTSHHSYNVRVLAEGIKKLDFQICDFGQVSQKIRDVYSFTRAYELQRYIQYFLPSETTFLETRGDLMNCTAVAAWGYPVRSEFTIKDFTTLKWKSENLWAVEPFKGNERAKKIFIVMGAEGVGEILKDYVDKIVEYQENLNILIGCGKNDQLLADMKEYVKNKTTHQFHCIGFTEDIACIGSICDAYITKPGGATVAEGIYAGFPMLLHPNKDSAWELANIEEAKVVQNMDLEVDLSSLIDKLQVRFNSPKPSRREYEQKDPTSHIYETYKNLEEESKSSDKVL